MNPETVLRTYFDGINAERYEDVGALFAPGAEIVAPGANPRGPEEIARYLAAALRPYPLDHDGPGTPLDVFELDGEGRIARLTTWYDSHKVRGALAAAMAAGGLVRASGPLAIVKDVALAAVAVAGTVAEAPPGLVVGEEWVLDALEPGWQGLLVAQSDHAAVVLS